MLLGENIAMAFSAILSNKMRSFLTMLGIIIGIGAVIAIETVGNSVTQTFSDSMTSMGATNIVVGVTQRKEEKVKGSESGLEFEGRRNEKIPEESDFIQDYMIEEFEKKFANDIEYVMMSEKLGSGTISVGGNTAKVSVEGGNETYITNQKLELVAGREIGDKALKGGKSACLISDYAVDKLFKTENYSHAVGKTVEVISGQKFYDFTIVGVYQLSDTGLLFGGNADRETTLYTTLGCVKKHSHIQGYPNFTVVKSADMSKDTKEFRSEIQIFFDRYYHTNRIFEVTTSSFESMLEELTKTMSTISTAISIIAGIALLVGGIGVMNIMLVSISERTREIGTRKALGATNSSIRLQFIIEAMVLCIIGGIIGILIGVTGGALAATQLMDAEARPSISSILTSVGFSMAIGLFFGYYPANKAAKMNPIDALTYE
ncbi:MAG: ABC transporter permease [Lachnospiraceae bacterium]|nr:ABC transporter permease [Lachnospiraceae bacterium]